MVGKIAANVFGLGEEADLTAQKMNLDKKVNSATIVESGTSALLPITAKACCRLGIRITNVQHLNKSSK